MQPTEPLSPPRAAACARALGSAVWAVLGLLGWLAGTTPSVPAAEAGRPRVVFLIGEDEYKTWETLPEFAEKDLRPAGYDVRVVLADTADKHRFPGFRAAMEGGADLLLVSVRRRALSKEDLDRVREHVRAGRPVLGIRTASHAFAPASADAARGDQWAKFDPEVLGGNYHGHHGVGPDVKLALAPGAAGHAILDGVSVEALAGKGSLYVVSPLEKGTVPLLIGSIAGKPEEPVAWTYEVGEKRAPVFYTSLGHPADFQQPAFRRLLLNGIRWGLAQSKAGVDRPRAAAAPTAKPLTPAESARRFRMTEGLEMQLVLSEPDIAQPLHISFDERGRLWLVEYRQYPSPAGLKLVSHDQFWRAVYDQVPAAPPHHIKGADRVSIHEDTDGDGVYDRHTVFVDGLNIATAAAKGRGGVWVLNPPYLLFYPDRNNDDVPDGDPEVHLEGFGIEDTHSVINSLRWGPDGWLYAAQGSTVSARVRRPGSTNAPVMTLGQNIWRYHPETRKYEVFSEGGGNAFGVEMDDAARVFSGHNGGNTRGFHYVQGGYLQKGFEKHGQLSNPYAFGYFPQMAHNEVERFTHTFVIYGGGAFSGQFDGRLFGIEPLQGRVVMSEVERAGSTFKTRDVGYAVTSADRWFKPVDIKHGPDGALYVADWYDFQVNHWRNYQGNMDASNGRVYRLKAKGAKVTRPEDLGKLTTARLVETLTQPNRWARQLALQLLWDRKDRQAIEPLLRTLRGQAGQLALESLWGLAASGGFTTELAQETLAHTNPQVREWTVRLLGDPGLVADELLGPLVELARRETDADVRLQLAASARRLPVGPALSLVAALCERDLDAKDPRQPLMVWWAIEAKAATDRAAVLGLFSSTEFWAHAVVREHLQSRVMRRYAQAGAPEDFEVCEQLLARAPSGEDQARLIAGFEEAFQGRSLVGLPAGLVEALATAGGGALPLQLKTGRHEAVEPALALVRDEKGDVSKRTQVIQTLGELRTDGAVPVLLQAMGSANEVIRVAALGALRAFEGEEIGRRVIEGFGTTTGPTRTAMLALLASRPAWARQFAGAVDQGRFKPDAVPMETARQMKRLKNPEVVELVARLWPGTGRPTSADMERQIARLAAVVRGGTGDPYNGKKLFAASCGACHKLFNVGGSIGPDLTPYRRDDLDTVLLNIVNPSAEIREGYENFQVETKDERSLGGFIVRQDDQIVVMRGPDGQDVVVARGEIAELRPAGMSLMPEGLLEAWDDAQIRDFFAYLRSSQPLAN